MFIGGVSLRHDYILFSHYCTIRTYIYRYMSHVLGNKINESDFIIGCLSVKVNIRDPIIAFIDP